MKQLLLAAALVFAGFSAAHAQTTYELPLTTGHAQIGGGFSWTNVGSDGSSVLELNPRAEYFLMNNLSLGGAVDLVFAKPAGGSLQEQYFTLAPSGTYYFWQDAGMATYINQRISLTFPNGGSAMIGGQTGLGIGFFLNKYVSIAPEINAVYMDKSRGSLNLMAMISAYL